MSGICQFSNGICGADGLHVDVLQVCKICSHLRHLSFVLSFLFSHHLSRTLIVCHLSFSYPIQHFQAFLGSERPTIDTCKPELWKTGSHLIRKNVVGRIYKVGQFRLFVEKEL